MRNLVLLLAFFITLQVSAQPATSPKPGCVAYIFTEMSKCLYQIVCCSWGSDEERTRFWGSAALAVSDTESQRLFSLKDDASYATYASLSGNGIPADYLLNGGDRKSLAE